MMHGTTRRTVTLSLTGAGHLLVYQLGAMVRLLRVTRIQHVVGASGGAIAATVVATQVPLHEYAQAFCDRRGQGLQLLQEFWNEQDKNNNNNSHNNNNTNDMDLHIATTRCDDGSSKLFSFHSQDLKKQRQNIVQCIRASCLIPPSFHPLDIVSSPSSYPAHQGMALQDRHNDGSWAFYVDGGIATPAPMLPEYTNENHFEEHDNHASTVPSSSLLSTRIIISPVAGTSAYTARISPRVGGISLSWLFPQIQVRHDLGIYPSWFNVRALQMASGNITTTELQQWYQRGQDDADYFLESFLD